MNITTDREAFNYIKEMLIAQNQQSASEDFDASCQYRAIIYNGDPYQEETKTLKCAVGQVIDDKWYDEVIEGETISDDKVAGLVMLSNEDWNMTSKSIEMLTALQILHDTEQPGVWPIFLEWFNFDESGNYSDFTVPSFVDPQENTCLDRIYKNKFSEQRHKAASEMISRLMDEIGDSADHWYSGNITDWYTENGV